MKNQILFCVVVIYLIDHISPQSTRGSAARSPDPMRYLEKYGYLEEDKKPGGRGLGRAGPRDRAAVIMEFQEFAQLPQTGVFDAATLSAMRRPRCGNPDKPRMRDTRRRSKRYVLNGSRWSKSRLSYRLTNGTSDLQPRVTAIILAKAFRYWANVTNLQFYRQSSGRVDIELLFGSGDHGDSYPFDGRGRVLAHAFKPRAGGDVHFDDDETWSATRRRGRKTLLTVAVHEIGHSLGLSHSKVPGAVMAPFYSDRRPRNFVLHEDDIHGIQSLYGKPMKPSSSTTTTFTTTDLTTLSATESDTTTIPTTPPSSTITTTTKQTTTSTTTSTTEQSTTTTTTTTPPVPTTMLTTSATRAPHTRVPPPATRWPWVAVTTAPQPGRTTTRGHYTRWWWWTIQRTTTGTTTSTTPTTTSTTPTTTSSTTTTTTRHKNPPSPRACRQMDKLDAMVTMAGTNTVYAFQGVYLLRFSPGGAHVSDPEFTSSVFSGVNWGVDAALSMMEGSIGVIFIFRSWMVWKFDSHHRRLAVSYTAASGAPAFIPNVFRDLPPSDMDAAFQWKKNHAIYVFKGDQYYRITNGSQLDAGYPRHISLWRLPLGVSRVDAVFAEPSTNVTYFFVGDLYYKYDDRREMVSLSDGYPVRGQTKVRWYGCQPDVN